MDPDDIPDEVMVSGRALRGGKLLFPKKSIFVENYTMPPIMLKDLHRIFPIFILI